MNKSDEMLSEDWIKEYEKIAITKKIHAVAERIGKARMIIHTDTKLQEKKGALMACIASMEALINSIPILSREKKKISEWENKVREYSGLVSCNSELLDKYKISYILVRDGMQYQKIPTLLGMDTILNYLDDLMQEINEWTTEKGLRITLPIKRKTGVSSILEEENINLIKLD